VYVTNFQALLLEEKRNESKLKKIENPYKRPIASKGFKFRSFQYFSLILGSGKKLSRLFKSIAPLLRNSLV
jgi:hypothetical protein